MKLPFARGKSVHLLMMCAGDATGASKLWGLTPSLTLDNSLSRDDFVTAVRLRLGVDVSPGAGTCCFRGLVADPAGRHALSCMSGGDTTALHNQIRDLIFDYCKRGGLHPVLEASRLLPGLDAARRRPADVLVLDRLHDGSMRSSHKPLALDFAVKVGYYVAMATMCRASAKRAKDSCLSPVAVGHGLPQTDALASEDWASLSRLCA